MGTKSSVLRCLIAASPDFISGAEIAEKLSISRQAVWKAVASLKEQGHNIESVTKKGYQYKFSDILSVEGIESYLSNMEVPLNILVRDEVDSTNKKLKELPYDEIKSNTVLAVTKQTHGTGRFSRSFFSDGANGGLYFSILLRPDILFSDMVNYTLIAAVAVVTALEKLKNTFLQIKWVNDIYMDGKKICGILTEAVSDIESGMITEVIIGIGINVSIPQDHFPEDIRQRVTSLFPDGETNITRNEILATILEEFYHLSNMKKKDILALYSRKSLVLGKRVTFVQNGEEIEGVAKSIGLNGELVVDTPKGSLSLNSGEISLKSF